MLLPAVKTLILQGGTESPISPLRPTTILYSCGFPQFKGFFVLPNFCIRSTKGQQIAWKP